MASGERAHQGLGAMLRELRTQRGLSVRTLAAQVGFSPSFISQIEADAASPSIASLEKIASALGVTLGQLFSSLEQNAAVRTVLRRGDRASHTSAWSQTTISVLSDASPERSLAAVELVIAPEGMSSQHPEAHRHDTFALVLSGSLALVTNDGIEILAPGDSAYLPSGMAFAWANQSEYPATVLLVGGSGRSDLVQDVLALKTHRDTRRDEVH
ncbi:MAG: XRE family transcriptional regulator [Chloroflexia bacterium]|nr:XRE family transcriptional regulator [Chloroflexia bacterium]